MHQRLALGNPDSDPNSQRGIWIKNFCFWPDRSKI